MGLSVQKCLDLFLSNYRGIENGSGEKRWEGTSSTSFNFTVESNPVVWTNGKIMLHNQKVILTSTDN